MPLKFHTGPGSSKHQLRCEVNRLTAELAARVDDCRRLRAELSETHNALEARDAELDALRLGGFLSRLRILFTGREARLAKELSK
jgi:hypothetical protein